MLAAWQLPEHSKSIVLTQPGDELGVSEGTGVFDKQKQLSDFWRGEEMTSPGGSISPFGLCWEALGSSPWEATRMSAPTSPIINSEKRSLGRCVGNGRQCVEEGGCFETLLEGERRSHSSTEV